MNASLKKAILYLLAAYFVTTFFGALLSIVLGYAFGLPSYIEAGVKPSQSPAYKVTEPFQPLLCLIVYSFFAYRNLRGTAKENLRREAFRLSYVGLIGSIVIDFVSFVLIPHPYAFTFTEFYVGYQPWITIIYAVIFVSPLLVLAGLKRQTKLIKEDILTSVRDKGRHVILSPEGAKNLRVRGAGPFTIAQGNMFLVEFWQGFPYPELRLFYDSHWQFLYDTSHSTR